VNASAADPVRLEGVRFAYAPGDAPALVCDELVVRAGLTLVVGPNGAGKSTLLRLVAGVEPPATGRVLVLGRNLWRDEAAARALLAYVPEHPELAPFATVGEVVLLAARLRGLPDDAARDALGGVGLDALAGRTVRELSMGQRRRALLAAARLADPAVLVLDEPLEAMDREMRESIVRWAAERRAAGAAVLVATHEVAPFAPLVDRVLVVSEGRLRWVEALPDDARERVTALERLAGRVP